MNMFLVESKTLVEGAGLTLSKTDNGQWLKAVNGLIQQAGFQATLGYTPVEQGGGVGQGLNKIKIGWSNNANPKPLLTVDALDQGAFAMESWVNAGFQPKGNYQAAGSYQPAGNYAPAGAYQATLGFTPVQQGTGVGQANNVVKLGWSAGGKLKVTVDATDLGAIALETTAQAFATAAQNAAQTYANGSLNYINIATGVGGSAGSQRLPNGVMIVGGTAVTSTGQGDTVVFPNPFPNAIFSITVTEAAAAGWAGRATVFGTQRLGGNNLGGFSVYCMQMPYATTELPVYQGGITFSYIAIGF